MLASSVARTAEAVRATIRERYGERVHEIVETLTRSPERSIPKEERDRAYHDLLLNGPQAAQALKVPDRLNNTRILIPSPDSKKRASDLRETEEKYLPVARQAGVLVTELERATDWVRKLHGPAGDGPGEGVWE